MSTKTILTAVPTNINMLKLNALQSLFADVTGETTRSPNRKFLLRKITEQIEANADAEAMVDATMEAHQDGGATALESEPETAAHTIEPLTEPVLPVDGCKEPSGDEIAPQAAAKPARGRFAGMTVEQLRALYLAKVGRSTGSVDAGYLIWKIREAEKGRITVGAIERATKTDRDEKILPLRMNADAVNALDGAWQERGIKSRMAFIRQALGHYLAHLGATEAAAHFTAAG